MAGKKKHKKHKGKPGKKKKSGLPDGFDEPAMVSTERPGYDYLQMSCPPSRMVWF